MLGIFQEFSETENRLVNNADSLLMHVDNICKQ